MKTKSDANKSRDGKRSVTFWLDEDKFIALRTRLLKEREDVQAWGERVTNNWLSGKAA